MREKLLVDAREACWMAALCRIAKNQMRADYWISVAICTLDPGAGPAFMPKLAELS